MDLLSDCKGWFRMEDNLPTTAVLNDGSIYDGVLQGIHDTEDISVAGKVGLGFDLDGANDRIWCSSVDTADLDEGPWTFAIWLQSSAVPSTSQRAFSSRHAATGYGYALTRQSAAYDPDCILLLVRNTDGDYYTVFGDIEIFNNTNWHLVIIQRSGDVLYMFTDNQADGTPSAVTGSLFSNCGLMIGARVAGDYKWRGLLDNWCFWRKFLSVSEKNWLWNNGDGQVDMVSIPRTLVGGSLVQGRSRTGMIY